MSVDVAQNLETVLERLNNACKKSGRNPGSVRLLAVSKTQTASMIEKAITAGQVLIGESYVQEFIKKREQIGSNVTWHFIGRIQTNKIKSIVGKVKLIHSVDRIKVLNEIEKQAKKQDIIQSCLLEINVGEEENKAGSGIEQATTLLAHALTLSHIKICGLMSIPPFLSDAELIRPYHKRLYKLASSMQKEYNVNLPELSMGMSLDLEVAIEEGATLVRVGTDIFGARNYKK